mmetsp:Transcript_46537/g.145915  ORF Transcript_46537/g.145915 Transcript_46537/m.145915 type:complete len:327 (+) Transcript_46537:1676-2656(+)
MPAPEEEPHEPLRCCLHRLVLELHHHPPPPPQASVAHRLLLCLPLLREGVAMLQEADEGSDACAGAHHDDGAGGVLGELELLAGCDEDVEDGAAGSLHLRLAVPLGAEKVQPVGAKALPLHALGRLPAHHREGEANARGLDEGAAGDGVEARAQGGENLQKESKWRLAGGIALEDLVDGGALKLDLLLETIFALDGGEEVQVVCLCRIGAVIGHEPQHRLLGDRSDVNHPLHQPQQRDAPKPLQVLRHSCSGGRRCTRTSCAAADLHHSVWVFAQPGKKLPHNLLVVAAVDADAVARRVRPVHVGDVKLQLHYDPISALLSGQVSP